MVPDGPHKTARWIQAILEEVRDCSGTEYDPAAVDAFIDNADLEGGPVSVNSARTSDNDGRPRSPLKAAS